MLDVGSSWERLSPAQGWEGGESSRWMIIIADVCGVVSLVQVPTVSIFHCIYSCRHLHGGLPIPILQMSPIRL